MTKISGILILLFYLLNPLVSQAIDVVLLRNLSMRNGLPNNSIFSICRDKNNFIWIGTADGLARFDGYNFKVFKHNRLDSTSISDNFISAIVEDAKGNLWIGTQGGGLNRFDYGTETFRVFKSDKNNKNTIFSDYIYPGNSMVLIKNKLWLGSPAGLSCIDVETLKINRVYLQKYCKSLPNRVDTKIILKKSDTELWLGSTFGLIYFNTENNRVEYFKISEINDNDNIVTALDLDQATGKIWVGTESKLCLFNPQVKSFDTNNTLIKRFFSDENHITSIIHTTDNEYWFGTTSGIKRLLVNEQKVQVYNGQTNTNLRLTNNYIGYLYPDQNGLLWVGLANDGIDLIDITRKQIKLYRNDPLDATSLSYNTIRSVYEDRSGNIWVGTYGYGLNKLDRTTGKFKRYLSDANNSNTLSHNIVTSVFEDRYGMFWVSTWGGGINRFNPHTGQFQRNMLGVSSYINFIQEENDSSLMFGSNDGLYRFNPLTLKCDRIDSDTDESKKLTGTSITKTIIDTHNNLWIATFDGLNVIFKQPNSRDTLVHVKSGNQPSSLSDNRITSLVEDANGTIWIGTYGGGLNKAVFKSNSLFPTFEVYTTADGLPDNIIYCILADNHGNLWLSTNNGISKFNTRTKTFVNFDESDGLQGDQFYWYAGAKCKSGELFFGGVNGLNSFFPDSVLQFDRFPPLLITNFSVLNDEVKAGKPVNGNVILQKSILETHTITLTYLDYAFSLEFAALSYNSPNKIKYQYKLEGFDKEWISTDFNKRYVSYSNLKAGIYKFRLKSTNEDGTWNSSEKVLHIKILPPIWKTPVAYIFYISLIILLLIFFRWQVLSRARMKHSLKVEKIEKERLEEYNSLKLKFFTNVSHEFRTPLTLIINPIQRLMKMGNHSDDVKQEIAVVYRNSKRLLQLINQVLDFRKADTGNLKLKLSRSDISATIGSIAHLFENNAKEKNIDFSIHIPQIEPVIFDINIVETLTYNLLSNAFKFTPRQGKISLTVQFSDNDYNFQDNAPSIINFIKIAIQDTGIGISPEKKDQIFQLFFQEEKSKQLGTGIGLSLCKEIVKIHHGKIEVDSTPGIGSVFEVILPVSKLHYKEQIMESNDNIKQNLINEDSFTSDEIEPSTGLSNAGKKTGYKLLIVEDDTDMMNYIGSVFDKEYSVKLAPNVSEAFNFLKHELPDLILSDIMMDGMDGLEFCQKIKSDIQTSHLPVVLLTALSSVEDNIKGLEFGADSYIAKPFEEALLKVTVRTLIESRKKLAATFGKNLKFPTGESNKPSLDEKFMEKVFKYIEAEIASPDLTVETLSDHLAMSSTNLYRKIKAITGLTTNELIRKIRIQKAAQMIKNKQATISDAMYSVGFDNNSYFSKCFKNEFGMNPSQYLSQVG